MAPWSLPMLLLLQLQLQLHGTLTIVSATTTVHFYLDDSCESVYATVKTDTNAGDGQCGEFALSIYSARSVYVDDGCSVTTYSGSRNQHCSNDATFVPTGLCTSMSIGSYSVDCMGINGTHEDAYRTLLAQDTTARSSVAGSSTSASTYTSTPPIPQTSSSQHDLMALISASTPPSSSITPILLPLSQKSPSPSSPSPPSSPSSSPSSSPPSSPSSSPSSPSSSSPSQPPRSSGTTNDGGLSGPSTIAIGVVLPGVAVVVAVIFGVLGVKRWREKEQRNNSTGDGEGGLGTLPPPPPYQAVLPPLPQTTAA